MSDLPDPLAECGDGVRVSVATFGRDARGAFVVIACNEQFFRMVGASSSDFHTFPIRYDDLVAGRVAFVLREELQSCFAYGRVDEKERVLAVRAGSQLWRLSLKPFNRVGNGEAVREVLVTGFHSDQSQKLTHDLEVSASRFRAVVDSAYDAIVTIDEQHRITLFNRAAENLFGYSSAEILGRRIETLLPERFRANHGRNVREFADSPKTSLRSMVPPRMDESNSVFGQHRDGTVIPVEIAISKIKVDGVIEFTAVVRDITERAQLMELLKKQAVTDALTGLPNRREFSDFLERALSTDEVLSVFMLDIDSFKAINDRFGHDVGDETLRVFAEVGKSISLDSKVFARWGGEEFVAAMPGVDSKLALEVANQLREKVERQEFELVWRDKVIPFTVSIGVVTRKAGERNVEALMKRADRALYQAKESGRNRVIAG